MGQGCQPHEKTDHDKLLGNFHNSMPSVAVCFKVQAIDGGALVDSLVLL